MTSEAASCDSFVPSPSWLALFEAAADLVISWDGHALRTGNRALEGPVARVRATVAAVSPSARQERSYRSQVGPLPPTPLWVDHVHQCGLDSPDRKHSCTIGVGHVGAHVAIDPVFGSPLAAWL